ncbi:OTU domain-containing protein 1 [Alosa alosa]|uniref:OTU domain-containing protein 1 n=1 Tax=Alosa alosa TaxID=278164 RepID=UPI0020154898|nr:OTU domain-containing protein 1 [Alosa alosa]
MPAFSFEDWPISISTADLVTSRLHGEETSIHPERQRNHLTSNIFTHYGDNTLSDYLVANHLDRSWIKGDTGSHGGVAKHRNQDKVQGCVDVTNKSYRTHPNSGTQYGYIFDGQRNQKLNELEGNDSLCYEDLAFKRYEAPILSPSPNVTGPTQEKVICYLWEVANQNAYLHERQKYRFYIIPDGNCLYRAVSRAAYGNQSKHKELREQAIHYIADHLEEFNPIIEGDVGDFLVSASQEGVWAGYPELLALSKLLNVNIYLTTGGSFASPTVSTMVHFLGEENSSKPVVWLSWLSNGHYDVVLNRSVPNPEYEEWYAMANRNDEELTLSV